MLALHIHNLRCFGRRIRAPIAPLTLLVGENSTGKSSFLAAVRLVWDTLYLTMAPDFNEEPFELGAFEQIATYRGGRAGRARAFEIGCEFAPPAKNARNSPYHSDESVFVSTKFTNGKPQPRLSQVQIKWGILSIDVDFHDTSPLASIKYSNTSSSWRIKRARSLSQEMLDRQGAVPFLSFLTMLSAHAISREQSVEYFEEPAPTEEVMGQFVALVSHLEGGRRSRDERPYAIAPIRTKPRRTYDPLKETPSAEGSHVPLILANIFAHDRPAWEVLKKSLDAFGETSDLWQALEIKRLGRTESDPFQITVRISGPNRNVIDVGYGVSQVLPILVDAIRKPNQAQLFLMQQPEVHLHPKAQAALGSFLTELAAGRQKAFFVETHSDYLLDRIRMEIRKAGALKSTDVSVLFFERVRQHSNIHAIKLDDQGNVINPPKNYRNFFLDEERRLFGLG